MLLRLTVLRGAFKNVELREPGSLARPPLDTFSGLWWQVPAERTALLPAHEHRGGGKATAQLAAAGGACSGLGLCGGARFKRRLLATRRARRCLGDST